MNNAIGAMIMTSDGTPSPVTARKVMRDWPLVVSRSNSRSACVIQIMKVSTPRADRNAQNVRRNT